MTNKEKLIEALEKKGYRNNKENHKGTIGYNIVEAVLEKKGEPNKFWIYENTFAVVGVMENTVGLFEGIIAIDNSKLFMEGCRLNGVGTYEFKF